VLVKTGILIVDDSLTVRMDLEEAFQSAGFITTACASASAAREALSRNVFALVVLDVLLPDADGIELLQEIRSDPATSKIPVLLLSTEAEVRDRVRGMKTGADEYVGKPYDKTYLVARTRELVRRVDSGQPTEVSEEVLIVDDSATYREALRLALESHGYRVVAVSSGEEALRLAVDIRPRAVIVDGVLPGIDGATVVRCMRQDATLRSTPCLLLTASEDPGGELQALDAGADSYLRKEEDVEVILARLAAVLRSSATAPATGTTSSLFGPKRILAVDDSLTYLQELAAQLRQEGYDPILAHSGEEALELLGVQTVDCILLDLVMPGLSGNETCRRIKSSRAWRDVPLLMLTAREERESMIEGINAGADDYIAKSSEFEVLKARLRAQLRRKQIEDEHRQVREQLLQRELEAAQARAALELAETRSRLLADLEKKNQELEAFSYSVSHDLRAPLRAIAGYSQILLEDHIDRLDDEGKRVLHVILESTSKMAQLIDDLLEFARVGRTEMKFTLVDMTLLAHSVVQDLLATCRERKIRASVGSLPCYFGDQALLRQVLTNLIGNSFKYTRSRDHAQIEVEGRAETDENLYLVRDNGVGFEMDYAHKLFGIFQRLHSSDEFEGTGVGLSLVQRVIQRHGGRVWAEAKPNQGATFYFALPKLGEANDRTR
jgi:DNA-binding response OmpR family regulator